MSLFDGAQKVVFARMSTTIQLTLRDEISRAMRHLPVDAFRGSSGEDISSHIALDVPAMVRLYEVVFGQAATSTLRFVGCAALVMYNYGLLASAIAGACLVYVFAPVFCARRLRSGSHLVREHDAAVLKLVHESITGMRDIRAGNLDDWDVQRLQQAFQEATVARFRFSRLQVLCSLDSLFYWAVTAGLYWFAGRKVISGDLTVGSVLALLCYFSLLEGPVRRLFALNGELQSGLAAAERIFDLLDRCQLSKTECGDQPLEAGSGSIEFRHVSFGYGGHQVLKGASFLVKPGQFVGIVGPSGAGKTTIASLLCQLYYPNEGQILINGIDSRQLAPGAVRSAVAVTFQDPCLFSASVKDNICVYTAASEIAMIRAARTADAHRFILSLPYAYDTLLTRGGASLSSGQRQRLALARAILRAPNVLVLDEAISAVDGQSERGLRQTLLRNRNGRTTIVISHRLSTVIECDNILVLDHGQIVAQGDHNTLACSCRLYRQLFKSQLRSRARDGKARKGSSGPP